MKRTNASRLSNSLAIALRLLVDRVSHSEGAVLSCMEEAGVTLSQVLLMNRVERLGGVSLSDLAQHASSSLAAVGQMVDRLVRAGLLDRREVLADRRRKSVSISKKGASLLRTLEQARTADYAGGLAGVTPDLGTRLCGLIRQAIGQIDGARKPTEHAS
jgi:DNA-binding MarR family transcriptional regulator